MINVLRRSLPWRACPQTGASVANESGAYSSDLELLEIVMPEEFQTVTREKP